MSRPCRAKGCSTPIAPHQLVCYRHWRMVTLPTRRRIRDIVGHFRADRAQGRRLLWWIDKAVADVAVQEGHWWAEDAYLVLDERRRVLGLEKTDVLPGER